MRYRLGRSEGKDEIINSTEYSSPWDTNSLLAKQETLLNIWNLKIYCHVHKWPLAILVQSTHCQHNLCSPFYYEGWNFNSGNYFFTTDTK